MNIIHQTSAGGIVFKKVYHPGSKIYDLCWLICQHSQHKGWVFPKGLVGDSDSSESMETAAIREVEEEGGIKAKIVYKKPIKTGYRYYWNAAHIKKTVYYYLMEYISGDIKKHDWEMIDVKFVSADEVKNTLTYRSDREAFKKILEYL